MSPNPSGVSISFTSEIYTKPHHFSPHHLLNCSSSHQHLLCLQFASITHNTVSDGVTLLQCLCKYIFPLFKILQWIFIARRIKSNLAKCSASKPWLGTSISPRRPQLFHWAKPFGPFFLPLKQAERFPLSKPLNVKLVFRNVIWKHKYYISGFWLLL